MDALSDYLRAAAGERFDRRARNCMTWVADWVAHVTGIDPAAPWRGLDAVDVLATAEQAMKDFAVTTNPQRGDVGVIQTPLGATAAIYTGRRWAGLAPSGVAVGSWPVIKAWSIA